MNESCLHSFYLILRADYLKEQSHELRMRDFLPLGALAQ